MTRQRKSSFSVAIRKSRLLDFLQVCSKWNVLEESHHPLMIHKTHQQSHHQRFHPLPEDRAIYRLQFHQHQALVRRDEGDLHKNCMRSFFFWGSMGIFLVTTGFGIFDTRTSTSRNLPSIVTSFNRLKNSYNLGTSCHDYFILFNLLCLWYILKDLFILFFEINKLFVWHLLCFYLFCTNVLLSCILRERIFSYIFIFYYTICRKDLW